MPDHAEVDRLRLSGANAPGGAIGGPIEMAVHDTGGGEGRPPVVLCHGFPDLGRTWRHQIPAIEGAGFRALAPDQRGYGSTTAPDGIEAYGLGQLCGDLADLLDAIDVERAVFVGHDWGGFVAWAMPTVFPERCAGVVGVCTPYTPFPGTEFLRAMFGDDPETMYMLWFQEPGVAERVLDRDPRLLFEKLKVGGVDPAAIAEAGMARESGSTFNPFLDLASLPDMGAEPVLDPAELDRYAAVFERTGFGPAINWYRNIDENARRFPAAGVEPIDLPTLMLCAEWDPALPPSMAADMGERCSDLEMHIVERAGHWLPEEEPAQVNDLLTDWLTRRFA